MQNTTTSRHLRSATELILLIPIKPEFVQVSELISYSTRLNAVLNALFELRRIAIERDLRELAGPVEQLRTIHRVQWTVIEPRRTVPDAAPGQQLLVTAHFDRSWEDYFRLLVDITGPLLDLVFSHCVGYAGNTCQDSFENFVAWVRRHQLPCDFLYLSSPDVTADDVRYYKELAQRSPISRAALADLSVGPPGLVNPRGAPKDLGKAVRGLYDLRERMFAENEELPPGTPPNGRGLAGRSGRKVFDDAMGSLLRLQLAAAAAPPSGLPSEVMRWLGIINPKPPTSETPTPPTPERPSPVDLPYSALQAIQGNILTGYSGMTHGCVALMRCDDAQAAAVLLRRVHAGVTSEAASHEADLRINFALTCAGLERLGLSEDVLALFPKEFREGMEARAGLLGDIGAAHPMEPERKLPRRNYPGSESSEQIQLSMVDAVIVVQGASAGAGDHAFTAGRPLADTLAKFHDEAAGIHILHVQPLRRLAGGREHFGFKEDAQSSSQPVPNVKLPGGADLAARAAVRDVVPLGELLLGYQNERGQIATCAHQTTNRRAYELFKDGTFMVMRKLEQDVAAFRSFVDGPAGANRADEVMAQIMGRDPDSGSPLALLPASVTPNDFDYKYPEQTPASARCPFHAHIRRANPRDDAPNAPSRIPRILRRGFSYGADYSDASATESRGLLFMAYNASIANQFEVIQRWINGGNSTGISSAQSDLLVGSRELSTMPRWIHVNGEVVALSPPATPLVSLHWGLYLFVPSLTAIEWLSRQPMQVEPANAAAIERGRQRIRALDTLSGATAIREWQRVLEEVHYREQAAEIWAAIHADGGLKFTSYGWLVATAAGARAVLSDPQHRFSVREYWHRLTSTAGEHYLALDPVPGRLLSNNPQYIAKNAAYEARLEQVSYEQLSFVPNQYLDTLTFDHGVAEALRHAMGLLANPGAFDQDAGEGRYALHIRDLARVAVAKLAHDWLGMPAAADDAALVQILEHFVVTSRHAFQQYPEPWVERDAAQHGQAIAPLYVSLSGSMADYLRANGQTDPTQIRQAMIGAVVGFAAPAIGVIVTLADRWIESGELWRLADLVRSNRPDAELLELLLADLEKAPVPPILYRTALDNAEIGGQRIEAGARVVVGLGQVFADARREDSSDPEPWKWLFGGDHSWVAGDGKPAHGCPARHAAIGVVLGVLKAVLVQAEIRRERRLVVSYAQPVASMS